MLKLKVAIELYDKEIGSISNSYEWYRKHAVSEGFINIGELSIKTRKINGIWFINNADFENGIKSHRLGQQKIKQNTIDYQNHIIHGKNTKMRTDWGHYINYGNFRLMVNDSDIFKGKNNGIWFCNTCNKVAKQEHKKEECHLCSDWNGCGNDCRLSLVFCDKCNIELKR